MEDHSKFIDDLGGTRAVAKLVEMPTNRVSNWRQRGIPWQWRATLARAAVDLGVTVPIDFFKPEMRETG